MLNFIWLGLMIIALLLGGLRGNLGDVGQAAIDSANLAVNIAAGLVAVMTLWLGLMRLADKSGLIHFLGRGLRPILCWLFPDVPADHPAMGAITMNMAANILGLNNAATPLGLRAMQELERLNPRRGVATNAMCMLLAINTSSITLIPVTVIALLAKFGSKDPTVIIGTSLAATAVAHAAAIFTCKLLERSPWYRLPPLPRMEATSVVSAEETVVALRGKEVVAEATQIDAALPWVPQAGRILAAVGGIFLALVITTSFPEIMGKAVPSAIASQFFLRRLIEGLSLVVLPGLIVFFPLYASLRRIPVYDEFVEGGKEGFQVSLRILPNIVAILVAVGMFRAAGGMEILTVWLRPLTNFLHFPPELVPLALIRPFSGGASLGLLSDLMAHFPVDSLLVLTAGTLYGCSETTFYVIAVYFGSVGIRRTRHAIPAGLIADAVGPIASVLICRAVFAP